MPCNWLGRALIRVDFGAGTRRPGQARLSFRQGHPGDTVENRKSRQRNWHALQLFSPGPARVTAAVSPSGPARGWTVFLQIDFPERGGVSDANENTPPFRKVILGWGQL